MQQIVRQELDAEYADGFPRLSRVPCTFTWRSVDHVKRLPPPRIEALFAAIAASAGAALGVAPASPPADDRAARELKALRHAAIGAVGLPWDWKYADIRTLRAILGGARSKHPRTAAEFASIPADVVARAEAIVPVTAAEFRKLVKVAVQHRFGGRPERRGGGEWGCECRLRDTAFTLSLDYGGWDQLRYEVSYRHAASGLAPSALNYERLLGLGGTGWNFITADNAADAVQLMVELVEWLVSLPDRMLAQDRAATG